MRSCRRCRLPLLLLSVRLPFTAHHEYVKEFKQAHRRDDDIAIVNAGMRFRMAQAEGAACGAGWGCDAGAAVLCIQPGTPTSTQ